MKKTSLILHMQIHESSKFHPLKAQKEKEKKGQRSPKKNPIPIRSYFPYIITLVRLHLYLDWDSTSFHPTQLGFVLHHLESHNSRFYPTFTSTRVLSFFKMG
jgi:hypothetical protein